MVPDLAFLRRGRHRNAGVVTGIDDDHQNTANSFQYARTRCRTPMFGSDSYFPLLPNRPISGDFQSERVPFMPIDMFHHRGIGQKLGSAGKKLAPIAARLLMRPPLAPAVRYAAIYLEMIQGKGAGAGWDLRSEARVAASYIRRTNPVVFDIGAHGGGWSEALMEELGGACRIFQFEPAPQNLAVLRQKASANVTLIEAAVSDEIGTATLHTTKTASDIGSLEPRRESIFQKHHYDAVEVQVTTIDEVLEEYAIDFADFVKMDIEGHELAALRGARRSIEAGKIRALSFEFGSGNINSRTYFHDFWDLLHPLGYAILRVGPGGQLMPVEEYYEDLEYFRNVTNYVAVLQ